MNLTHRILVALALVLVAQPALGAETVIDQLYGLRNYDLADAYWAAGQKFTDLGQTDRGEEFKARARQIFPGYVPGQSPKAQPVATAPAPTPEPTIPAAAVVREKNLQGEKIARLQFQKLLRGYLTDNAATLASALAPSVTIQGEPVALDAAAVAQFLDAHPAEAGAPDDLFNLDTLETVEGTGTDVVLTVKANPDAGLTGVVPFWKPSQSYTFSRVGDTWKLSAVQGQ